jgi:hypothetical protein
MIYDRALLQYNTAVGYYIPVDVIQGTDANAPWGYNISRTTYDYNHARRSRLEKLLLYNCTVPGARAS